MRKNPSLGRKGQIWVRRSVEFHLTDWFNE
jgi:hypothetical protein